MEFYRGLRTFPQKVSHFGKIKKANYQKVLKKYKDFKPLYPGHLAALDTVLPSYQAMV